MLFQFFADYYINKYPNLDPVLSGHNKYYLSELIKKSKIIIFLLWCRKTSNFPHGYKWKLKFIRIGIKLCKCRHFAWLHFVWIRLYCICKTTRKGATVYMKKHIPDDLVNVIDTLISPYRYTLPLLSGKKFSIETRWKVRVVREHSNPAAS